MDGFTTKTTPISQSKTLVCAFFQIVKMTDWIAGIIETVQIAISNTNTHIDSLAKATHLYISVGHVTIAARSLIYWRPGTHSQLRLAVVLGRSKYSKNLSHKKWIEGFWGEFSYQSPCGPSAIYLVQHVLSLLINIAGWKVGREGRRKRESFRHIADCWGCVFGWWNLIHRRRDKFCLSSSSG